jgi:glucose-1-phosphate cytidylyltransferase
MAFEHVGFFQPMDTLRDKTILNDSWDSDKAPWKIWD